MPFIFEIICSFSITEHILMSRYYIKLIKIFFKKYISISTLSFNFMLFKSSIIYTQFFFKLHSSSFCHFLCFTFSLDFPVFFWFKQSESLKVISPFVFVFNPFLKQVEYSQWGTTFWPLGQFGQTDWLNLIIWKDKNKSDCRYCMYSPY